jgi:hypothetical protein
MYPRHGGFKTADFVANDAGINQQERLAITLFEGVPDMFKVQANFRVSIEDFFVYDPSSYGSAHLH